ncbi:hypothetical protein BJ138DRAFT_1236929 [Hygrophoropsis aurantiaca]|uniref:Uncharacterized protein n=1 Tax=Hygrophoropsis aurantiaca TaxID=72124 RepID=A0ACB7ZTT3_9AGAM|nr:hypothetical protein BJ138DRAFT_1236929 [Hygrophoropsis aurantiaca]
MSSPSPTRDSEREERTLRAIRQIPSARRRRHAHRAAYLLGMTDEVPPPPDIDTNQLRIVRACYDAMERRQPVEGSSQADGRETNAIPPRGTFNVTFKIPLNTTKLDIQTTSVSVSFPSDIAPDDIFSRICAYMEVPRSYEGLAWRLHSSPRNEMPTRLTTDDDLRMALKAGVEAILDREEIEVNNVGKRRKKKLPPPVVLESPATPAKNLRGRGSNRAPSPGSCVPTKPPTSAGRKRTHAADAGRTNTPVQVAESSRLARQHAVYLESDDSDDGSDLRLADILCAIHAKYPDLNYYQHEDQLRQRGILYLSTAHSFDADFFTTRVGMSEGAARNFQKWVARTRREAFEQKKKKLGKRRA